MNWPRHPSTAQTEALYAERSPSHTFSASTPDESSAWARGLRPQVAELLTLHRMRPAPLNARIEDREETAVYTIERVVYQSEPGVDIPAALLVPKNLDTPTAAMLCPPGHGRGIPDQLEGDNEGVRAMNYDYARQFAERGYVVIVPEVRGFGSLADPELEERSFVGNCNQLFNFELMLGRVLAGVRVWDMMRAIDYLVSRDEVDAQRIGCAGLSMGGELSMLVAAMDERVQVAMISGFLCTYHGLMIEHCNCNCYMIPNVWDICDMPDIAGLIAPRPLVVETGRQDGCFPWSAVNEAYGLLEGIYAAYDADDKLVRDTHPGAHRFSGEVAFEWFDIWLRR
jgi:hypothetical protein